MGSLPTLDTAETSPERPVSKAVSTALSSPAWQRAWGESFRSTRDLLTFLGLNPDRTTETTGIRLDPIPESSVDFDPNFPLRVPRAYADLMVKGDWNDPLLRQVLAHTSENIEVPGFTADAVGDRAAQDGPAVLRKYKGRALLVLTGECAVHCRYCFRREYPYAEQNLNHDAWENVYAKLDADSEVEEILFSGGDPLSLSDAKLRWHFVQALRLTSLRRLRVHTRVPVVLPARVDDSFLALIREVAAQKPLHIVLHINHANEISSDLMDAAKSLREAGAILLNQSVLLRGVNDTVEALESLSLRLLDAGILPYYLHQLDRVRGAQEFEMAEEEGLRLMDELRKRVPGYGLPRYVREIAGEESKTEVGNREMRQWNNEAMGIRSE
jgi:EF-P beta-lysylation protein EpmB